MQPTQYSAISNNRNQRGHTLLELIVASSLTLSMALLIFSGLTAQLNYFTADLGRKRVQLNLRGAMDIVAMNIRQAGEGLDRYFPAITLEQKTGPVTSEIALRRKIVHEVMLLCKAAVIGDTKIFVSDDAATDANCLPTNVASALAVWKSTRQAQNNSLRIYLYDRVGLAGEFLDYSGEDIVGGDDYLLTSPLSRAYPTSSTSAYVIEEFRFNLDSTGTALQLRRDGYSNSPEDVAYNLTSFQVSLRKQDGTTLTTMSPSATVSWQDLRAVILTLGGEGSWRNFRTARTLTAEYFPRNVLSK